MSESIGNNQNPSHSPQLSQQHNRSSSPIRRKDDEFQKSNFTKYDDERSFSSRSGRTHTPPEHLSNHHSGSHRSREDGGYKRPHYHHNQNRWNTHHTNFSKFNKSWSSQREHSNIDDRLSYPTGHPMRHHSQSPDFDGRNENRKPSSSGYFNKDGHPKSPSPSSHHRPSSIYKNVRSPSNYEAEPPNAPSDLKSANFHHHRRPHRHYPYRERDLYPRDISPRNAQYTQFRPQHHAHDRSLRDNYRSTEGARYQDTPLPHPNSFRFEKDTLPPNFSEVGSSRSSKKGEMFYAPERPPGPYDDIGSKGMPDSMSHSHEPSGHHGDSEIRMGDHPHEEMESGSEDGAYSDRYQDLDPNSSQPYRRSSTSGDRPPHNRPQAPFMNRNQAPIHPYRSFDRYKSGPPFNYSKRYPDSPNPGFRANSRYGDNFHPKGSFRSYKGSGSDLYRPGHKSGPGWNRNHSTSKYGSSMRDSFHRSDSRSRSPSKSISDHRSPSRSRYSESLSPRASISKKHDKYNPLADHDVLNELPPHVTKDSESTDIIDKLPDNSNQPRVKSPSPVHNINNDSNPPKSAANVETPNISKGTHKLAEKPLHTEDVKAEENDIHWFDEEEEALAAISKHATESSPKDDNNAHIDSTDKSSDKPHTSTNVKGALQPNHMPVKFTLGFSSSTGSNSRGKSNQSSRISLAMNDDDPNADEEPESVPITKPNEEKRYLPPHSSLLDSSPPPPHRDEYRRKPSKSRHPHENSSYSKYKSYAKFSESESDTEPAKNRYNYSPMRKNRSLSSEKKTTPSKSTSKIKDKMSLESESALPVAVKDSGKKLKPLYEVQSENSTPKVIDDEEPKPAFKAETNDDEEETIIVDNATCKIQLPEPSIADSEQTEITVDETDDTSEPTKITSVSKELESTTMDPTADDELLAPVDQPTNEEPDHSDKSSDPINIEENDSLVPSQDNQEEESNHDNDIEIASSKDVPTMLNNSLGLTIDPTPLDLANESSNHLTNIPDDLRSPPQATATVSADEPQKETSTLTTPIVATSRKSSKDHSASANATPNIEVNTTPITTPDLESDKGIERPDAVSPDPHNQPYDLNGPCHPFLTEAWCRQVYLSNQSKAFENASQDKLPSTIYRKLEDFPSYQQTLKTHESKEKSLLSKLKQHRLKNQHKSIFLKLTYKKLYDKWKKREQSIVEKENDDKFTQLDLNGLDDLDSKPVTRSRRAGLFNGDAVRSEAELNEILERLGSSTDNLDLTNRVATIPPMILDNKERELARFDNRNPLVINPTVYFTTNANQDVWDEVEEEAFIQAYLQYPKQFGKISEGVGSKNQTQCVLFYYLNKKRINFKDMLSKGRKYATVGRRRKANPQTPSQTLTSVGTSNSDPVGRRKDKGVDTPSRGRSSKLTDDIADATTKKSKAGRKKKNPDSAVLSAVPTKVKRSGRPPKSTYRSQTSTAVASPRNDNSSLQLNDAPDSGAQTPQQSSYSRSEGGGHTRRGKPSKPPAADSSVVSNSVDNLSEDKTISKEITPNPIIELDTTVETEALDKYISSPDRTVSVDRTESNDHTQSPPEFRNHPDANFPPDPRPIPHSDIVANQHYHQPILASNYQSNIHRHSNLNAASINSNLLRAVDHVSNQGPYDHDYNQPTTMAAGRRPNSSKPRGGGLGLGGIDSLLNNNPEPEYQPSKWDKSAIMEWFGGDSQPNPNQSRLVQMENPQPTAPVLPSLQALHLPTSQPRNENISLPQPNPSAELFRPILTSPYGNTQRSPLLPPTSARRDSTSFSRPSTSSYYAQYSEPDPYMTATSQAHHTPPPPPPLGGGFGQPSVYTHHNPTSQFRIGSTPPSSVQQHPSTSAPHLPPSYDPYPQHPQSQHHSYNYSYQYQQTSYVEAPPNPSVRSTSSIPSGYRNQLSVKPLQGDLSGPLPHPQSSDPQSSAPVYSNAQQRYLHHHPILGSSRRGDNSVHGSEGNYYPDERNTRP